MRLENKVAIISGAGRGLGRAVAFAMASEGAAVVLLARTAAQLDQVVQEIIHQGGNALAIPTDVSLWEEVQKGVDRVVRALGGVDIVVNNAAVTGPIGPLHTDGQEGWAESTAVNLSGVFYLSRAVCDYLVKKGQGKIINVTSGLGSMVMPGLGAYSIAKAGVIHLTRIMAEELRPHNVQVNGLDPGVMDTSMQDKIRKLGKEGLSAEIYKQFVDLQKQGHLKPPEKVAKLAVFLASSASDNITGHIGTESDYQRFGYGSAG